MCSVLKAFLMILWGLDEKSIIAKQALIFETNFDLPESAQSDLLILPRVFIRTLGKIVKAKKSLKSKLNYAEVAALGESERVWGSHRQFNQENQLPLTKLHLSYGQVLESLTLIEFFGSVILFFLLVPVIMLPALLSKRRASYANCLLYACQLFVIQRRLKLAQTKLFIDYSAYSNQSNWLALVLMKRGVEVIKIPSIVPFAGHFKNVIASKLWLSTPYHLDETNVFASTHFVGEYLKGKPKNAIYLDKYETAGLKAMPKVLGYYSHASWLRADQDHGASEFCLPEMEETVLRYLVSYCEARNDLKLHVFTHPRERSAEMVARTKAYYHTLLAKDIVSEIYFGEERSSLSFEAAEVGVGTMSSILFERLLCGFKTLFYTDGMISFPVPNSDISSICAPDKDKLFEMLDEQFASASHAILDRYRYDAEFYTQKQ
ncbi:hypothetical protein N9A49_04410 [Salibacteraceae bacterium]|nr:hypothetical protein [Salibacteraceae bacterium]